MEKIAAWIKKTFNGVGDWNGHTDGALGIFTLSGLDNLLHRIERAFFRAQIRIIRVRHNTALRLHVAARFKRDTGAKVRDLHDIHWRDAGFTKKFLIGGPAFALAGAVSYFSYGEFSGTVNNKPLAVNPPKGGSFIVATIARGLQRELNSSGWCPSGNIFSPGHIRYDICGFQDGVQAVMRRSVKDVQDNFVRVGPESPSSKEISDAYFAINRDSQWSIFSSNDTLAQYSSAVRSLDAYNKKLAVGQAEITASIPNLESTIRVQLSVLGGEASLLRQRAEKDATFGPGVRYDFYRALGAQAANCWVMKAVNADFVDVIRQQSATAAFKRAAGGACVTIGRTPWFVINGDDFSALGPSHLVVLFGWMSDAINQLNYVLNSLASAPSMPSRSQLDMVEPHDVAAAARRAVCLGRSRPGGLKACAVNHRQMRSR